MSLNGQAEALAALHFDEVRTAPATTAATDRATYRTFDGQVIELTGHREGEKAYVSVAARRDPALAAKFPEPAPQRPLPHRPLPRRARPQHPPLP